MDDYDIRDKMDFISDPSYRKVMQPKEKLYWSGESIKINSRGKRQNRLFIITNQRVINIGKRDSFIWNMW